MILTDKLVGRYVYLRSVEAEDASFILQIRNDPQFHGLIPGLSCTIAEQESWIAKQRSSTDDYYFLICELSGKPLGTISVYHIQGDEAESGRIVSYGDARQNIEAILLLNDFVFDTLKLKCIHGDVFKRNKSVISLNKKLGVLFDTDPSAECDQDDAMIHTVLPAERYWQYSQSVRKMLGRI